MLTCKSPRKVMRFAYALARRCLPRYSCKFSRHWCRGIGMKRVPDHNTLCRAFHALLSSSRIERLMDRLTGWMACIKGLGTTCAIDSTLYDTHHRSRHYEQRCRHYATHVKNTANLRRSRAARRTPKLSLSVDTRCHLILAARTRSGMGSDARDFVPLLRDSKRRVPGLRTALADAGYDSHRNHRIARGELKVRSWIKASAGRPSDKPPTSRYRRLMRKKLSGSQKGKPYGQRAQAETVNSMMKRNLGDHLRARTPEGRRKEQMLKVITHDLMILLSRVDEG